MESNFYQQSTLYGNRTETMINFLSKDTLSKEEEPDLIYIIYEHLKHITKSKQHDLPPFGKDFEWLNTNRSLSSKDDLGKKIYVIDFFTYCCINCVHILPYLKEVEHKHAYNPGFAVIGVHSPKFPNEKSLQQVKEAIIRNNIKHPVLNDPYHVLWKTFGITCWPTVFIVGPNRILLFVLVGERQIEKLSFLCDHVLKYFENCEVELDLKPLPISEIKNPQINEIELLFPGNVSTNGKEIIVSDTGHNRLVLMSQFLEVKEVIGSGFMGYNDGSFDVASFNSPHGTAWYKGAVYVADTGNHRIRKIDFQQKVVSTVFKERKVKFELNGSKFAKFNSPWDVCVTIGRNKLFEPTRGSSDEINHSETVELSLLYIAVAGSHQIWALDLEATIDGHNVCMPVAGSGREENRQNRFQMKAGFAQPSGIIYSNLMSDYLFVADSESSTIKSISLKSGAVVNVIGGGLDPSDLFQFGDHDGTYTDVKLQHPMGVCVLNDDTLVIADTYNHKLKIVHPEHKKCETVQTNIDLNEPSSICILDDRLFVADTNNHRIVTIPIDEIYSKSSYGTFDSVQDTYNFDIEDNPDFPETLISLSKLGKIVCYFKINQEHFFRKMNSQNLEILFNGIEMEVVHLQKNIFHESRPKLILRLPTSLNKLSVENKTAEVTFIARMVFCDNILNVCLSKKAIFRICVKFNELGSQHTRLNLVLNDISKLM